MKISCKIELKLKDENNEEEVIVFPEDIINIIKDGKITKYSIKYDDSKIESKNENKVQCLKAKNKIDNQLPKHGIYFILSYEMDELFYVGKSQTLGKRLTEHLIECNKSTDSHIKDVSEYLKRREKNLNVWK